MSTDRDVTRIVRSWLKEDGHEVADRVLDRVVAELDTTPQRGTGWSPARRFSLMNSTPLKFGVAAAAVLAIAVGAINVMPGRNPGQDPSPTPSPTRTPAPTISPSPLATPDANAIPPGAFVVGDPFPVEVTLSLGEGWRWWSSTVGGDAAAIYRVSFDGPNGTGIVFATPINVTADPCTSTLSRVPQVGPEVADLADALAEQPHTNVIERSPVTVDGYSGEYLDYSFGGGEGCPSIYRWPSSLGPREAVSNERDRVWILDVDGTRLVIDVFSFPQAPAPDVAEILQIVEAAQIDPLE